jgi:hypothetical protein
VDNDILETNILSVSADACNLIQPFLFLDHLLDNQSALMVVLKHVESIATEEEGLTISGTLILLEYPQL